MSRLATGIFISCSVVLAACQGEPEPSADQPQGNSGAATPVTLTRFRAESLAFTHSSGFDAPALLVIRDSAGWSDAWQTIHERTSPVPALPPIDFSAEVVLLVALGERNSGGHDILILSAAERGDTVVVRVRETSPGSGCITTGALTQPMDLARLPRPGSAVAFRAEAVVHHCGS